MLLALLAFHSGTRRDKRGISVNANSRQGTREQMILQVNREAPESRVQPFKPSELTLLALS